MKFYYTYVLLSKKDKNFYTGWTIDLKVRFGKHIDGKVPSTKYRRPLILIYYEACRNKDDAMAREKFFKSGMGRRYLKNRSKKFLSQKPLTG